MAKCIKKQQGDISEAIQQQLVQDDGDIISQDFIKKQMEITTQKMKHHQEIQSLLS